MFPMLSATLSYPGLLEKWKQKLIFDTVQQDILLAAGENEQECESRKVHKNQLKLFDGRIIHDTIIHMTQLHRSALSICAVKTTDILL